MGLKRTKNRAHRDWWAVHVEAWQRSGLSQRAYCRRHRLTETTFSRWLKVLVGDKALRAKQEIEREERLERRRRKGSPLSADGRSSAVRSVLGDACRSAELERHERHATMLGRCNLSPHSLRRWRDLFDSRRGDRWTGASIFIRAPARAISSAVSSAAKELASGKHLTQPRDVRTGVGSTPKPPQLQRRSRSCAIVLETEQPGVSGGGGLPAPRHRHQHGVPLARPVRLRQGEARQVGDGRSWPGRETSAPWLRRARLLLHDLLPAPDGMMAVELPRRTARLRHRRAPIRMRSGDTSRAGDWRDDDRSCRRESASGARLHRHAQGASMGWRCWSRSTLKKDPFSGHLFAFRGKRASMLKMLFWDGNGLCLFTKRLDQGGFVWPRMAEPGGTVTLSPAQLAMLIEGIDWRAPERVWRPRHGGLNTQRKTQAIQRKIAWFEIACRRRIDMRIDLDNLPSDTALLHHLVREMADGRRAAATARSSGFRLIIKKLQRAQFGRRSERLDPDQLALALEDLDADIAPRRENGVRRSTSADDRRRRGRSASRCPIICRARTFVLDVDSEACPCCGGALHAIGESVSEMLDWVPAQLRVMRIRRPKYACRACGTVAPGAGAGTADCRRAGDAGAARAGAGQQILRSHAALSPVADLCPARRRSRALDAGRLGRRRLLVARSAARAAVRERVRLGPSLCRRHADPGARSRPRPHEDRAAVGLCAR